MRTLLTCPVSVWVGYQFGPYAHEIIKPYRNWFFLVVVLVVAVFVVREYVRRRTIPAALPFSVHEEVSSCGSPFEQSRD